MPRIEITCYRQREPERHLQTLIELEHEFKTVFDTFSKIDDDVYYDTIYAPPLQRDLDDEPAKEGDVSQLHDIDLCVRFFFLLWARTKLVPDEKSVYEIYMYYLKLIFNRPELRKYADKYYPIRRSLTRRLSVRQLIKKRQRPLSAIRVSATLYSIIFATYPTYC